MVVVKDALSWKKSPAINNLELAILDGAVSAQRLYEKTTGGWWLSHGPEAFLQVMVAKHVAEMTSHSVYIDCSLKKIQAEIGRGRGRPANNAGTRPDLSIWHKSSATVRAAIEIKRAWNIVGLRKDAKRLETLLKQALAPDSAYLLVYSEARGKVKTQTLSGRFAAWQEALGWQLVGSAIDPKDDGEWVWGICLLRRSI